MRRPTPRLRSRILRSAAALALIAAPAAAILTPPAPAMAQVAASTLVDKVDIPYSEFTLKNGLRVIVHTDRKAPIVAVSVWYNVGSKHEPLGKTGFAHLFEHLMFNGSENAPGDFFEPLQQVGATDFNGTTWFDRTNYFQTVPTSALEVALFLESDRMGHLLGAVTQEKLDNQRGVVQNEKRQGDNQPYGMVEYAQLAGLLPPDHPYGHSTIGSMADLDKASLADVKQWFTDHYGPNNAIIVLAGDIDAPTAKKLVTKYFGDIPRGKAVASVKVDIPTLAARKDQVLKDRVATTRLYRWWTVPGLNDPDNAPLAVGASVLGGLASSRLDNILVKDEQLAVRVTASLQDFAQLGFFEVTADVKPGVDPAVLSKRLDEILADYVAKGPTEDEVKRVAMTDVSGRIGGMEQVGGFSGKATVLAESALYSGRPDDYKKKMAAIASATPEKVRAAMGKWLTRPVFALSVVPGERDAYEEAGAGTAAAERSGIVSVPARYLDEGEQPALHRPSAAVDRSKLPEVGTFPEVDFPTVETATLSNGIKVHFARRDTVPTLRLAISFDAGKAADPRDRQGTQALMLAMLKEGTRTRNSIQIAEEQERLGASISVGASQDRTVVGLYALTPNIGPSLDLLADIVLNPAFDAKELERVRAAQLAQIAQERTQPGSMAARALIPILYGPDHPYGIAASGSGDPDVVKALSSNDLAAFHRRWIRADTAEIFAVGDMNLDQLKKELEARFAAWPMTRDMPGRKNFDAAPPAPQPRIVLVNRPQSPQSFIFGGMVLKGKGGDDLVDLISANDIMSGDFLSRTNMDLRETKGWSYGVRGSIDRNRESVAYLLSAPVQADKTGASIAALREQITTFLTTKGVTPEELHRTTNGSIRELPGSFETSGAVLGEMQRDALLGRPFDYVETLADRYRAQTAQKLDQTARGMIDPAKMTWVVVGDSRIVLPQLKDLGLPVTVVADEAAAPPPAATAAATQ
ncbi:zinc protease [Sphingobium jiangsuense]|uniref:Putative Zn-dependent peptidase n=1 Tax=Sphingobium jiangsuense TaxID=870476 RepID=A0A7W6BPY4_9SPHN|nr:pitrilysin family protein [Sphingobium jiangsuense]MBB3926588.1 putative Zn-dependent peptidase [Sphingobium jiangsuense]GLT00891.1 zinc protease [Sphingobium jiangsuense]